MRRSLCISLALLAVMLIGAGVAVGLIFGLKSQDKIPDLSASVLYSNVKETELMKINDVHVFGLKDYNGNVQGIHAIQVSNVTYTIDNYRLTQIQSSEYTFQFNYNDTSNAYYIMVVSENSSYQLSSVYNAPLVNFPQFEFQPSLDANISDPFTGILIELTDSTSQLLIPDATLHLKYRDSQYGNRSITMININAGRYYALLPTNDIDTQKYFDTKNLHNSIPQQSNSLIELFQSYPMDDICSNISQMVQSFCNNIKEDMNNKIVDALRTASKYISHVPLQSESSDSTMDQFEIEIRIPGEVVIIEPLDDIITINPTTLTFISKQAKTSKGRCNEQTVAGANTPDDRRINIGKGHVAINFHYETYTVKDQIDVYYTDEEIFSSGCVGTQGERVKTLRLDDNEAYIRVKVTPNCAGGSDTEWYYTIECPSHDLICDKDSCYCGIRKSPSRQVLQPTVDGCGKHRQWYLYWLIHSLGTLWRFTPTCNTHDVCYGTCNTYKRTCDNTFCADLNTSCQVNWGSSITRYYTCLASAKIFCSAVRNFGSSGFNDAQNEDCWCD